MSSSRFTDFKARMGKFGLHFDERIQQRDNNGLLGMFASDYIPKGTVLTQFTLAQGIPISKEIDFSKTSREDLVSNIKVVHSIARELSDSTSVYKHFFEYCGDLSDRSNSVCFFELIDFESLAKLSPLLANSAMVSRMQFDLITDGVSKADPSLSADSITLAALISRERCWSEFGFMPGMDLFNHNAKSGLLPKKKTINGENYVVYISEEDIQKDEEIKISYGAKDMYDFATNYNFFDPNDYKVIKFSQRIFPVVKDDLTLSVIKLLENKFRVHLIEHEGKKRIEILECGAYFLENRPNSEMLELASILAISNEQELKNGRACDRSISSYLLTVIDTMMRSNRISEYLIEDVPDKLQMFYKVLLLEHEQLNRNRKFVSEMSKK